MYAAALEIEMREWRRVGKRLCQRRQAHDTDCLDGRYIICIYIYICMYVYIYIYIYIYIICTYKYAAALEVELRER